jgi:hypothetical protein
LSSLYSNIGHRSLSYYFLDFLGAWESEEEGLVKARLVADAEAELYQVRNLPESMWTNPDPG